MNFSHLRAFHAVAAEGGYTRASRALGISQPTLSLQVRALEDRYGVKLFEKKGRGVLLTEFGDELLDITGRLFACADEADELLGGVHAVSGGNVYLGASGPFQIIPIITAFRARYPDTHVSLTVRNGDDVLEALRERKIDIAVLCEVPGDVKGLESLLITRDPLCACVAPDHPWARRKSVRLADFAGETLIIRERGTHTRKIMDQAFAAAGLQPKHMMESTDWESVRELAAAGLGVSVMSLPDSGTGGSIARIPIHGPKLMIDEFLVFYRERRRIRIVRAFLDVAGDLLAKTQG